MERRSALAPIQFFQIVILRKAEQGRALSPFPVLRTGLHTDCHRTCGAVAPVRIASSECGCPKEYLMITRFDRVALDLPIPKDPNPNAASLVQEPLGGKFGEMSTLMNYTFQSMKFRGREG